MVKRSWRSAMRWLPSTQVAAATTSGMPRLLRIGRRNRRDRLAGRRLERAPQVGGGGVAVGVALHIGADAGAERVLAEIVLQHADEGLALGVGDGIERRHRLAFVGDRLLDRMGGAAGILAHRALLGSRCR